MGRGGGRGRKKESLFTVFLVTLFWLSVFSRGGGWGWAGGGLNGSQKQRAIEFPSADEARKAAYSPISFQLVKEGRLWWRRNLSRVDLNFCTLSTIICAPSVLLPTDLFQLDTAGGSYIVPLQLSNIGVVSVFHCHCCVSDRPCSTDIVVYWPAMFHCQCSVLTGHVLLSV